MKLSEELFRNVVRDTCLVAIDFIIRNEEAKILVGMRSNPPAQGFWFVPGGRIFKNETIPQAVSRITNDELGVSLSVEGMKWLGVSDHIYPENIFGDPNFGTHYLVLAVECFVGYQKLIFSSDAQHNEFKFMSENELITNSKVHHFSKRYFQSNQEPEFFRFCF